MTDHKTGLLWQRTWSTQQKWADAAAHCSQLTLAGFSSDWRLPTKDELMGIVDSQKRTAPMIDTDAFPNTPAESFWTSTSSPPGFAYVNFCFGTSAAANDWAEIWARCVR